MNRNRFGLVLRVLLLSAALQMVMPSQAKLFKREVDSIIQAVDKNDGALLSGYPYIGCGFVSLLDVIEREYFSETGRMFHVLNPKERKNYIKSKIGDERYVTLKSLCMLKIDKSILNKELDAGALVFLSLHLGDDSRIKEAKDCFFDLNNYERMGVIYSLGVLQESNVKDLLGLYAISSSKTITPKPQDWLCCMRYACIPGYSKKFEFFDDTNQFVMIEKIKYHYSFESEGKYVIDSLQRIFSGDDEQFFLFSFIVDLLEKRVSRIKAGRVDGYEELVGFTSEIKKLCSREEYAPIAIKYLSFIGELDGVFEIVNKSSYSSKYKDVLLRIIKERG